MHVSRALWCVCVYMFTCLKLYKCVCVCASSPALCFWGLWSMFLLSLMFLLIVLFFQCLAVIAFCQFLNIFFLKGTAFKLRMYAERESLMIVLEKKKHSRKKENPF